MTSKKIIEDFGSIRDFNKSKIFSRFFKTEKGQYGYGDLFLGISVPETRKIAHKYKDISFKEIETLLKNKYHEIRLCALLVLVKKYEDAQKTKDIKTQKDIYNFYLKNIKYINNWDLVDLSCYKTIGDFCFKNKKENVLYKLIENENLWIRRVGIVSVYAYIKNGDNAQIFKIAKNILEKNDNRDLIQKATGWMLRESGKRVSQKDLVLFLKQHYKKIPRTMYRYSIEKLSKKEIEFIEKSQTTV